jgi:hypothetical protein
MAGSSKRDKDPGRWTTIYWPDRVLREEAQRKARRRRWSLSKVIRKALARDLGLDPEEYE